MSSERGNQQPPFGGPYPPDGSDGNGQYDAYGGYAGYDNYGSANDDNGRYGAQRPTAAPIQRGPLSSRIAAQLSSQPPAPMPPPGTYDANGNYVDYGNDPSVGAPGAAPRYPVNEADLWNNGQQPADEAFSPPQLPAPQLPVSGPALPAALTPQPRNVAAQATQGNRGTQGAGEQEALLQACLQEYARMEREVGELMMLVRQTSAEAEQLAQRKTIIASQVREMEGRLETYARTEIRDTYRRFSEAEMRAFMISEQREQLQAKLQAYERYKEHLRRTIDFLRLLPAAMSAALSAAQAVAQSSTMPTTPAVPATPPQLKQPAQPAPRMQQSQPAQASQQPAQQPARSPQAQPTSQVQQASKVPSAPLPPQPQPYQIFDAGSSALTDGISVTEALYHQSTPAPVPAPFIETGEDVTAFLGAPPPALSQTAPAAQPAPNTATGSSASAAIPSLSGPPAADARAAGAPLARVIQSQEELRRRLAQRLHDGPAQAMSNVALATEMCERVILAEPENPALALVELGRLKEQVNAALQETRAFIFELRPMALDDLGLVAALRRYTEEISREFGVDMMVNAPNGEPRLSAEVGSALFRIAQEALMNAVKHARPRHALVTVMLHPQHVLLVIDDDGGGFDVEQAMAWAAIRHSTGITSMQERAEMLHGSLRIQSELGRGSRVEALAPLSPLTAPAGQAGMAGQP